MSYPHKGSKTPSKYTGMQMRLFNALCKDYDCKTEVEIVRDGEFTREAKPKCYSIDILVNRRVAVEVDGDGHDFEKDPIRDAYLDSKGLLVLHIPNNAVKNHLELCLQFIGLADKFMRMRTVQSLYGVRV